MTKLDERDDSTLAFPFGGRLIKEPIWRVAAGSAPPQGRGKYLAVLPGADVTAFRLDVPSTIKMSARPAVVRSLLLSRVASPIDALYVHLAPPRSKRSDGQTVLVTDKAGVSRANAQLNARCLALVPDYALLPFADGVWVLSLVDGMVLFRDGFDYGWSLEPDLARAALELQAANAPRETAVVLLPDEELLRSVLSPVMAGRVRSVSSAGLTNADVSALGPFDLRNNASAGRTTGNGMGRSLGPLLVCLVSLIMLNVAFWTRTSTLEAATRAAVGEMSQLARQHYIGNTPILALRTQVERAIAARDAAVPSDPSETRLYGGVLASISPLLTPEALEVMRIASVDEQTLSISLRAQSLSEVETLSDEVMSLGLSVTRTQSQVTQEGDTTVELRIREKKEE